MGEAVVVGGLVVVEVEDVVLVVAVVEGAGATVVVADVEVPGAGVVTGGNDVAVATGSVVGAGSPAPPHDAARTAAPSKRGSFLLIGFTIMGQR